MTSDRGLTDPVRSKAGLAWAAVAVTAYVVAALSLMLGWISGLTAEQAQKLTVEMEKLDTDLDVGITQLHLDPTVIGQLDPGEYVAFTGWSLGGIGQGLLAAVVVGAIVAVAGAWTARPMLQIATALTSALAVTLAALALAVVEWINLKRIPFADSLPEEVRNYLPDLHAAGGFWLFVGALAIATIACAQSTVACYRSRYGNRWDRVAQRRELAVLRSGAF